MRPLLLVLLVACSGGPSDGDMPLTDAASNINCNPAVNISGNHGHVMVVTREDLAAGMNKTWDITGTAGHGHMVTLEGEVMLGLDGPGVGTQTFSTVGGTMQVHSHIVDVYCTAQP